MFPAASAVTAGQSPTSNYPSVQMTIFLYIYCFEALTFELLNFNPLLLDQLESTGKY